MLTLAVALLLTVPAPRVDDTRPSVVASRAEIRATLGDDVVVRFDRRHASVAGFDVGETTVAPVGPRVERLRIEREYVPMSIRSWTIRPDEVALEIQALYGQERIDLRQTLAVARVAGAIGFSRHTEVVDLPTGHWYLGDPRPPSVWFSSAYLQRTRRSKAWIREHYGFSTVSDPGLMYCIMSFELEDGVRLWLYRSGHDPMSQDMNPHTQPNLTEVLLVDSAAEDERIDLGDVIAELVTQPHDRKTLLQEYAPERYAEEYD